MTEEEEKEAQKLFILRVIQIVKLSKQHRLIADIANRQMKTGTNNNILDFLN